MRWRPIPFVLLFVVSLVAAAPQPPEARAPLLFVRVQGPEGMSVTFLESNSSRSFDAPVTVGLRPCFVHRARLDGLPNAPNASLYPSFEVRGTLRLSPRLKAADFPAPVVFTPDDISKALAGTMVTKVILLEDADKTANGPLLQGQPVELEINQGEDALAYAATLGRPVLIVRLGRREPDAREIARIGTGMILYPGMVALPPLSTSQAMLMLLPDRRFRGPCEPPEEVLRDGGDQGKPIHLAPGGELRGLEPSDSVAEFKDSLGRVHLKPTNTVCLTVPRFLAIRQLTVPLGFDGSRPLASLRGHEAQDRLSQKQAGHLKRQVEETEMLRARQRLNANLAQERAFPILDVQTLKALDVPLGMGAYLGTDKALTLIEKDRARLARQVQLGIQLSREERLHGFEDKVGPHAVGNVIGVGQVHGTLQTREVVYFCEHAKPELPEQPLCLLKWASAESAQVGDVVTFFIRYSNVGGKPIRDIAISDSLTGRLEYLPGTARSDREAVFVTQENEAGSLILRWEVRDPLPPGQKGVVSFQTRVR